MGRNTTIAWTDHTFNGVRGCAKVSPGCDNCYAEKMSKRNPAQLGVWGEEGTRVLAGPDYWANLDRWHRAAVCEGALRRVFCYSLGDVFESPRSLANADVCAKGRSLLFAAIERLVPVNAAVGLTAQAKPSGLIFLLLTKRPENVKRMVPPSWLVTGTPQGSNLGWPRHVWLGTSVENQQAADERVPHLLAVPGVPVRFLSLEPLLERVNVRAYLGLEDCDPRWCKHGFVNWLIPGGEGIGRRPCDLAWIRDLRDQGKAADVSVFVKQVGSNPFVTVAGIHEERIWLYYEHPKGGDPAEWPEDLRVQEVPEAHL